MKCMSCGHTLTFIPRTRPHYAQIRFAEFRSHIAALAALRVVNNNPQVPSCARVSASVRLHHVSACAQYCKFGQQKERLIVDFALENHAVLKKREKR